MAMTKNEKYIVEQYVRYFGKVPTDAQIADYADLGKPKLILAQIRGEADDAKAGMSSEEFVNSIFQNLFGRDASTKELNKYSKMVDNGKDLPINAIVKNAKPSDKKVYQTKKAVAELVATEGSTTNYDLDKITKDTYEEIYNPKTKKLLVDTVAELDAEVEAMPDNVTGQTFTLTAGMDTLVGTDKGDVFTALIDSTTGAVATTMTTLDSINGGAGIDTMNINVLNGAGVAGTAVAALPTMSVSNVEIVNIQSAVDLTADVSDYTGLTTANVILAKGDLDLTAADTTNVNVSGTEGTIDVQGGKNVVVTDATAAKAITVGNSAAGGDATGTITITDTDNSGANTITVEGGTDVTVTTTADKASSGNIIIGDTTNGMATGNVVVTQNTTHNATTGSITAGNVTVTGGKTVEITANMTNTAVKGGASGNNINAGTYTVTADNTTTDVTITQNATATNFANDAAEMVKETSVVTFNEMKANETLIINGLTFTASKDLTAAEVAAAFANLTAADTQSATGITANGIYSGTFTGAGSVWTSGAANGATVTFTAQDNDETDLTFTGTAATNDSAARIPTQVISAGTAAGVSTAVNVAEVFGDVVVNDNATKSITTITLDGFDNAALGAGGSLDKLATLNLTNGQGSGTGTVLTSTVATLNVTLNDMAGIVDLDGAGVATLKTLNLTTTGEASTITLDAAKVETLTIAAGADLDISNGSTNLGALKTATITGAGNVDLGDLSGSTSFATLTASAATGNITASVDGDVTAVTTGSGDDSITLLTTTSFDKAINLGAGDDTLTLTAGTTVVPTAAVNGGAGTDTISMTFASAASYDTNENFKNAISGFERLVISNEFGTSDGVVDTETINLANLGFASYVTTTGTNVNGVAGATATDILTLSQLAANATVVLTANGSITAVLATATGTTDVINVIVDATNTTTAAGTFTVADVETVKITAKGEFLDDGVTGGTANDGIDDTVADIASLALVAAAAKTVTVDGYADLNLTTTAANLKTIDALAMTGDLTYTINSSVADFALTSGSGIDAITISTSNNAQVKTGAGDDTITVQAGAVSANIWGGAGNDVFDVTGTISSATQYVTIEDATAGDQIILDTTHFLSGSVSITDFDQMTLTDKFNAVLGDTGLNVDRGADDSFAISFQHAGNTYIVVSDGTAGSSFGAAGTDQVIKLTGLKDLSAGASFNVDGTLEIA
ncbi:MAG: hypothetical protein RBR70_00130 [Arcobacter sp.]|jgi:S-layer protein|uniref:beta strand repeat-containing protein n=1 Tax=Arcobacter sp. TaxID=1872629 RepID=UPI002A74E871|nr:hypothetical protein [Arcobacter sp.]MDY3203461.1 hypothetical protein [Arcobacter sp.]